MQRRTPRKIALKQNLIAYYFAIGVIVFGYIFLGIGSADSISSKTLGPVIMVIGYLFAVPFALLSGEGDPGTESSNKSDTAPTSKS